MEIVSVAQNSAGRWMMTIDGTLVGDSRSFGTREEAVAYTKKMAANWTNVAFDF